ncbi:MAG: hypothetical protein K6G38_06380 [Gammaproteobacteria bacterium]|nr:hypothetical protein [Gammaproteobacteria bacterium]
MNNTNDLKKKYDQNNNLNAVREVETPSGANLSYIANNELQSEVKSQLEQDTQISRDQAMQNVIAGLPDIQSPSLTISPTKPDLNNTPVTDNFTTRDQVMSRLGLMDENYNYTDTYTNYINQGGSPLPGYEYAHEELLAQERYDQIFQKEQDGLLTHDQALLDAYGHDIMATMGYDVTSVAYWQNKFLNKDYSNPFDNRYLMSQVLQAAEEYHQARQAGQYAHSNIRESNLQGLVGEELSAEKMRELFPDLDKYADDQQLSDNDFRKLITSGRIGAEARLVPAGDGKSYYYLHTDGQLYVLDNQNGDHHGSFELDTDGHIKEISLNNSDVLDFTRHFAASATSVFTGLGKLGALVTSGAEALFTDKSYMEALTGQLATIDSFLNDTEAINWLTDTGHIDLDGFQTDDLSDWMFMFADVSGMIVGGLALGEVGGLFTKGGAALTQGATSLSDAFSMSMGTGLKYAAGKTLSGLGNLAARSTGMYQGAKGTANNVFTIFGLGSKTPHAWAPFANHALKTVPVYMAKDFYQTVGALSTAKIQAEVSGQQVDFTNDDIMTRALQISAVNGAISMIFAGGINDNQMQRLGVGRNGVVQEVSRKLKDQGLKVTQENILKHCGSDVLKKFLSSRRWTIAANTAMDLFDNFATMSIQDAFATTKKGDNGEPLKLGDIHDATESFKKGWIKNAVQASIMTFPTLRGQLETNEYNVALQELGQVNAEILAILDAKIKHAKNADDRNTLELVKQDYVQTYNASKADTAEGRIMEAVSHLSDSLNAKEVPQIVQDAFKNVVSQKKTELYTALAEETKLKMEIHKAAINDVYKQALSKESGGATGLFRTFGNIIFGANRFLNNKIGTGIDKDAIKTGSNRKGLSNLATAQVAFDQNIDKYMKPMVDSWHKITGTTYSDELISKLTITNDDTKLDQALEIMNYDSKKAKPEFKQAVIDTLGEDNIDNYTIFRIKNEAGLQGGTFSDRMKGNIMKTSLEILAQEGDTFVTKIDDQHYAIYKYDSGIKTALTMDTMFKLNSSIMELKKGNTSLGMELVLSTILGDDNMEKLKDNKNAQASQVAMNVLNTAYKNGALTLPEATSILENLLDKSQDSKELSNAMSALKKEVDLKLNNADNFNDLNDIQKQYKVIKALEVLQTIKDNKIGLTEKQRAAQDLIINGGPIVEEVVRQVHGDDGVKALKEWINSPQEGDKVLEAFQTLSLQELEGKSQVKKTLKKYGIKATKDEIENIVKYHDKVKKLSQEKRFGDNNIVTLDYTHDFGEEVANIKSQLLAQAENRRDDELSRMNFVTYNLSNEYRNQLEAMTSTDGSINKTIEVFDLSDPFSRMAFVAKAEKLDIFEDGTDLSDAAAIRKALITSVKDHAQDGVGYSSGIKDIVKLQGDMDAYAERLMNRIKTMAPELYEVDVKTNEARKIDARNQFRNEIKLVNLSDAQAARFRVSGEPISIIPGQSQEAYILNKVAQVLNETDEEATKAGTIGGQGTSSKVTEALEDFVAEIQTDQDLSKHFALAQIIETINSAPDKYVFRIKYQDDIISKLEQTHIIGKKGFYDVSQSTSDFVALRLKPDAKDLMMKYLSGKEDVNLFRILPLLSSDPVVEQSSYYRHPMITDGKLHYNNEETMIPDMHFNLQGINALDDIFNISFSWDTQGKLKNELLFNLCKIAMDSNGNISDFNYNPFDVKPGGKALQKLLDFYETSFKKLAVDNSKAEDWRAWAREDTVIKRINKLYQDGDLDKYSSEQIADMIAKENFAYYGDRHKTFANASAPTGYTWAPAYRPNSPAVENLEVSAGIIARAYGLQFDPIDPVTGKYYDGFKNDLVKAIDEFKSNVQVYTDYQTYLNGNNHSFVTAIPTRESQFAHAVGASNGYFAIEDLDWIHDMEFEEFRKYFDKSVEESDTKAKAVYNQLTKAYKTLNDQFNYTANVIVPKNEQYTREYLQAKDPQAASVGIGDNGLGVIVNTDNPEAFEDVNFYSSLVRNKDKASSNRRRISRLSDLTYKQDGLFTERAFNSIAKEQDRIARDAFATPANVEVLDLQDYEGLRAAERINTHTEEYLTALKDKIGSRADGKQVTELAQKIVDYTVGASKYNPEYTGIFIVDKDSFDIVDALPKTKNPFEALSSLSQLGKDLKGKVFLSTDMVDMRSNEGVKFSYKDIVTDEDAKALTNMYLEDAVESMYSGEMKKNFPDKKDYIDYISKLDTETFNDLLEKQARTHLSKKTINNIIVSSINDMLGSIDEQGVKNVLIPQVLGNSDYNIDGLTNLIKGETSGLLSTNSNIRRKAELSIFGQSYDALSNTQKEFLQNIEKSLKKRLEIKDVEFDTQISKAVNNPFDSIDSNKALSKLKELGYSAKDVATGWIINSEDGACLTYKTMAKQKLSDMDLNKENDLYLRDYNNKKIALKEIRDSLENDDNTLVIDIEGENKKLSKKYTLDEMFQIAINGKDENGQRATKTYFILHKDSRGNIIDPREWVSKNISKDITYKDGSKTFYGKEEAYRNAVSVYENYSTSSKGNYDFITIDELKNILGNNKTIIAYNGKGYDFKILENLGLNNRFLDATEFHAVEYAGDNPFKRITQTNLIGANKNSFADVINETQDIKLKAHDAGEDTQALASWIIGTKDTQGIVYTLTDNTLKSKYFIKTYVDKIADTWGVDKEELYSELDDFFNKGSLPTDAQKQFRQEMVDASDTAQIMRYLNFMQKDDFGWLLYNYENKGIFDDLGIRPETRDLIQNKGWIPFQKEIAWIMTTDQCDASTALNTLINMAYNEQSEDKSIAKVLSQITDPAFAQGLGIDEDNKDYRTHLNNLKKSMSKGLQSNKDKQYGFDADIQNHLDYATSKNFLQGIDSMSKAFNVGEDTLEYFRTRSMSPTTTTDPDIYNQQQKLYITNKEQQKFNNLMKDIDSLDTLVATKVNGAYRMLQPLNTFGEQLKELTVTKKGNISRKLTNIKDIGADTIVLSKGAAQLINGGNPIESLFDENGEAWCYSLAYPSDKQSHLLAHKLRIVEGDEPRIYATPMVMKVLRARDFDGDFITVFNAGTPEQKAIAKASSKYLYKAHDVQEKLLQYTSTLKGDDNATFTHVMQYASQPAVLKACLELDKALEKGGNIEAAQQKVLDAVKTIHLMDGSDEIKLSDKDILKYLGVDESKGRQFRYVANPLVYTDDTFSRKQRQSWLLSSGAVKSNVADSIYGYFKKWKLGQPVDDYKITNPLSQLNSTQIYLTDELIHGIDKISTAKEASQYLMLLTRAVDDIDVNFGNKAFTNNMNDIRTMINSLDSNTNIEFLKPLLQEVTNNTLYDIEYSIRTNKDFNKEVLDIMKNNVDSTFEQQLKHQMRLKEIKDSSEPDARRHIYKGGTDASEELAMIASKYAREVYKDKQVVQDISKYLKTNKATVGVLLDEFDTGEDAILVNKNTNIKQAKVVDIRLGKEFKLNKLPSVEPNTLLTAAELNNIIEGANFTNGGYITDVVYKNGEEKNVNNISGIRVVETIPLESQKLFGLGKGKIKTVVPTTSNETDFDFLINEAIFKSRKLGNSVHFDADTEIKTVKLYQYDSEGKRHTIERRVAIFKDVPSYIVGDDTDYDPSNGQRIEAMAYYGSRDNLGGFGYFGTGAYNLGEDGELYRTDRMTRPLFEDRDNGHVLSYSNAVQQVQSLKTDLLGQAIDYFNLWNSKDKSTYLDEKINSSADLRYAMLHNENIASLEYEYMLRNLKNFIIKSEGREAWENWLQTRTDQERKLFSADIDKYFGNFKSAARYKFFKNGDVELITSKNKIRENQAQDVTESMNTISNQGERTILPTYTRDLEDFYIPFNDFYHTMTGYYLNDEDIIDATAKGVLGYRTSLKGEANTEGNFKPVDSIYSTEIDDALAQLLFLNNYKNGHGGVPDVTVLKTLNGMKYSTPTTETSIADYEKLPTNTSMYRALVDSYGKERLDMGYKRTPAEIAYLMYTAADARNDNNIARAIASTTRNIDDVLTLSAMKDVFSLKDGDITYQAKDFSNTGTFKDLNMSDDLNLRLGKYNYYTHKEIYDKYNQNPTELNKDVVNNLKQDKQEVQDMTDMLDFVKKSYDSALGKQLGSPNMPKDIGKKISFTFDHKATDEVFKTSYFEGSGIKIVGEDTANVAVGIKNYSAVSEYSKVEATRNLSALSALVSHVNPTDFENFCKYNMLQAAKEISPTDYENKIAFLGVSDAEVNTTLAEAYKTFRQNNPDVVKAYDNYIGSVTDLIKSAEKVTNEPFGNLYMLLAPYMPTNKDIKYGTVQNAINNALNLNYYDPTYTEKGLRTSLMFNFFDSSKKIINDVSKLIGIQEMSKTLANQKLLDNVEITDAAYDFITENLEVSNLYSRKDNVELFNQVNDDILSIIDYYTDIDVKKATKGTKTIAESLQRIYKTLDYQTEQYRDALMNSDASTGEYLSLSTVQRLMDTTDNVALKDSYEKLYNNMWAKVIIAQRLIEICPKVMENVTSFLNTINGRGYTLCNKYGQKISMDSYIRPLADSSMSFLPENIELAYNNSNPEKFAQWVLEKALSGDLYMAKSDLVDQLEDKIYTRKIPSKTMSLLQDISKKSASIQMALPAKIIDRIVRFTGFDYAMGALYNPSTIKYMEQAQREILAAVHTQGGALRDNETLRDYMMREGQPIGAENKDPITFAEDIDGALATITNKLSSPLAIQNHLGRYAIYLAALEGFKNGDAWYGPAYMHKDEIDKLQTNEDKAMFVMDYMLGSPGGFPYLSKKTSGLMMYATFPMNLTRTAGAWAMSVGKLAQEGFTSENAKHWMRTVAYPSVGIAGLTMLSQAFITYICELFGVDDETKKKWKKAGVSVDPVGTIIGGTPAVTYDSINPIKNLEEMFVAPFTNEYNNTFGKKLYGLVQNNVLGKLNPAIKAPIEVLTQKDMMGNSLYDVSNQYDRYENAIRKTLGFFIGSGMANNMIDQFKIDKYNDDSTFGSSLKKGFTRGLMYDLGNQKSWKKNISNYYSSIDSIKNYTYANNVYDTYDATTDDLIDANYLDKRRNTGSKYGEYDKEDYARINALMKKMIRKGESPSVVYSLIVKEYNNGVSEATLKSVLNSNSIIRKLERINKADFYKTLSDRDLKRIQEAIIFEQNVYPLLQEFFPNKSNFNKYKLPNRKKYYNNGGSTTYYSPRTTYPRRPTFVNYYPNGYGNKKISYKKPKASIERVDVKVSPQMGVWTKDYNKTKELNHWTDYDYNRTKPLNHGGGK